MKEVVEKKKIERGEAMRSKKIGGESEFFAELEKRKEYCTTLFQGILFFLLLFSAFGAIVSMSNWYTIDRTWQPDIYTGSRDLRAPQQVKIIGGGAPLSITLPNDLSSFLGPIYSINCLTSGHVLTISGGPLISAWMGSARNARCDAVGAGFLFQVYSPFQIRLIDPRNMTFY